MKNIKQKILSKIYRNGRGWAFSAKDFLDIAKRSSADTILFRLYKENKIKKVITGIYSYPMISKFSKTEVYDFYKISKAIARKFCWRIIPDGNTALNYLGLSNQVVSKAIYLSDGPTREYNIENFNLNFKHISAKEFNLKDINSSIVFQALKTLGESNINEELLKKLADKYTLIQWQKIKKDTIKTTEWIRRYIVKILEYKKDIS